MDFLHYGMKEVAYNYVCYKPGRDRNKYDICTNFLVIQQYNLMLGEICSFFTKHCPFSGYGDRATKEKRIQKSEGFVSEFYCQP